MNATLKKRVRQLLPRGLKPHHIRGGPLQSYRIVTSWHDYPAAIMGRTERPLLDWFAREVKPGETWLDVGAHYGYTAIALAHYVGTGGRVFAFEPMLASAGCIAQTRQLNALAQLTVVPLALGNAHGMTLEQLPIVRGMLDSTLVHANGQTGAGNVWQEPLMVVALDDFWQSLNGNNSVVHGIKIDVQGMEIQVVRGMLSLLRAQQPKLVVEVHHGVSRPELLDLLRQAGYISMAVPIEPIEGETTPQFVDDKSYAFMPTIAQ